jgi:hypothetical protein
LGDLIDVSAALERVDGNSKKLSEKDFEALKRVTKLRFRGEAHFKKGQWFLTKLGIADNPLFANMTDHQKTRIYDLAVEYLPQPDPNATKDWMEAKKVFAKWALAQNPTSVSEFVSYFQFARSQQAFGLRFLGSEKAREKLFSPSFGEKATREWARLLPDVKSSSRAFHWGAVAKESDPRIVDLGGQNLLDVNDQDLVAQVRGKSAYFDTDHVFAYHVYKHWIELQTAERKPSAGMGTAPSDTYVAAAQAVIHNPNSVATSTVSQDGSHRIVNFDLTVVDDGREVHKKAVVKVDQSGWVSLATYMPDMK